MGTEFHRSEKLMNKHLITMYHAAERIYCYGATASGGRVDPRDDVQCLSRRCILSRDCLLEQSLCMPSAQFELHQNETFLAIIRDMRDLIDTLIKLESALLS